MGDQMVMLLDSGGNAIIKAMMVRDMTLEQIEQEARSRWAVNLQTGYRLVVGPVTQVREVRAQFGDGGVARFGNQPITKE